MGAVSVGHRSENQDRPTTRPCFFSLSRTQDPGAFALLFFLTCLFKEFISCQNSAAMLGAREVVACGQKKVIQSSVSFRSTKMTILFPSDGSLHSNSTAYASTPPSYNLTWWWCIRQERWGSVLLRGGFALFVLNLLYVFEMR
jgi:hypothetical protein